MVQNELVKADQWGTEAWQLGSRSVTSDPRLREVSTTCGASLRGEPVGRQGETATSRSVDWNFIRIRHCNHWGKERFSKILREQTKESAYEVQQCR